MKKLNLPVAQADRWALELQSVCSDVSFFFRSPRGHWYYMTHGTEAGRFDWDEYLVPMILGLKATVIACHPAAVHRRYPKLSVLGRWEGITWVDEKAHCFQITRTGQELDSPAVDLKKIRFIGADHTVRQEIWWPAGSVATKYIKEIFGR